MKQKITRNYMASQLNFYTIEYLKKIVLPKTIIIGFAPNKLGNEVMHQRLRSTIIDTNI